MVGPLHQVRLGVHLRDMAPNGNEGMEAQVFEDGEIVTHIADRKRKCEFRDHGVVDSTVPVGRSYDSKEHPGWVGVTWTRTQWRHPKENLFKCECPA